MPPQDDSTVVEKTAPIRGLLLIGGLMSVAGAAFEAFFPAVLASRGLAAQAIGASYTSLAALSLVVSA